MKILHVGRSLEPCGGVEVYLRRLLEAQAARGDEVGVLLREPGAPLPAGVRETTPAAFRPDIVHVHDATLPAAEHRAIGKAAPLAVTLHNLNFGCAAGTRRFADGAICTRAHGPGCFAGAAFRRCPPRRDPRPFVRRYRHVQELLPVLRQADALLVASRYMHGLATLNGLPAARCHVAPLFVERPASPPPPPTGRDVCFLGRVVADKGLDVLVRALSACSQAWERLLVVGDGQELPAARELAAALDLGGRVDFLGWLEPAEVVSTLRRSALVALPVRWPEPFGLVGIEAMAQGRAVIGSRAGAIPEWLADGITGVLVEPGDAAGLARAVEGLLAEPARPAALGRAAWEAAGSYSLEAHLAAVDAAYAAAGAAR